MLDFLKRVIPYYRPHKKRILWGLLFIVVANGFQSLGPWVLRNAINGLENELTASRLWQYAGVIIAVAVGSGLFRFLMRRTIIGASRHVEYSLRQNLFEHLLSLEPAFYDRSRIGDLMTRSTSDIEQVRMVIGPALMYTTNTIFGFIFGISLMLAISVKMTLIVILIAPIVSVVVFFVGRKVHTASTQSQQAFSDLSAMVQENLSGIRVVKAFRQIRSQEEKFDERSSGLRAKNMRLVLLQAIFMPAVMFVFGGAVAGIMILGGKLIIDGVLRVGDFVAFVSYLMLLTWPMISVGWVVSLFQRGRASLIRIQELLGREPSLADPSDPTNPNGAKGEVRFDHVTFTYPEAATITLEEVSFDLKSGGTLGVVGRVGSGKSTIASLLARLYEIDKGSIQLNGVDLRSWRKDQLRARLAVVPQDPLLFSVSIRENITLGGDYSDEDVAAAVEISRLVQDVPEFPRGLETEVGERGITLSGGQKQRVAIARAVIRRPEVIVFDDALSAVDADTEERILENLSNYLEARTAIIISHRISSVANADEVLVLDEGKVVERGHHKELLESKGVYADIFKRQKMEKELENSE
ncbi:ABC transporter ATP-binding protein/permease [bacterium]|nr:ABC transporter ATP-binding protein/permease [bacterium]